MVALPGPLDAPGLYPHQQKARHPLQEIEFVATELLADLVCRRLKARDMKEAAEAAINKEEAQNARNEWAVLAEGGGIATIRLSRRVTVASNVSPQVTVKTVRPELVQYDKVAQPESDCPKGHG